MALSVSPASNTIMVDDTFRIKAETAPSSAKVTYAVAEESKDIVRVSTKGNVRGLKAGTATITVTASYGGKKVKKDIKVTVDNTVPDGITAKLTNEFNSANYPDVVIGDKATIKVTYGENDRPVSNEYVRLTASGNREPVYINNNEYGTGTGIAKTDANGIAVAPLSA